MHHDETKLREALTRLPLGSAAAETICALLAVPPVSPLRRLQLADTLFRSLVLGELMQVNVAELLYLAALRVNVKQTEHQREGAQSSLGLQYKGLPVAASFVAKGKS